MIWSGSFDDNKTAMSVIEGDKDTAEISSIINDACKSFLSSYMYQWEQCPFVINRTKTGILVSVIINHSIFLNYDYSLLQ
ncbi:MAG: hypothetical protein Ct9H300mP17_02840 [Candidatus Nitrosopelagicus sp.]|nr:MAG: hypothetical protein Ct9H300mP17_02840 [Candidatus Nitrosopelagicus sp.]